jgi:hypothetical protein
MKSIKPEPLLELTRKHPSILSQMRLQILSGTFLPGEQFPTLDDLERTFKASRVTVHKALNRLAEEGFVYTRGRRGTYVADHPPHLWNYALVFPTRPGRQEWTRFWLALSQEAVRAGEDGPRRITCFYGANETEIPADEFERLVETVRSRRVAGVIFTFPPPADVLAALRAEFAELPVVSIASGDVTDVSKITPDSFKLLERGVDYLKQCGRKRIALFCVSGLSECFLDHFSHLLAERGMITRPHWIQFAHQYSAATARNVALLLMNSNQTERPDGLFIMDDNLVEYVTAGLIAAGTRVPEDLQVVAHCNFPWPTPSVIPARRLGFDAAQVLETCLQAVDEQVRGNPTPRIFPVMPVFEDERA